MGVKAEKIMLATYIVSPLALSLLPSHLVELSHYKEPHFSLAYPHLYSFAL